MTDDNGAGFLYHLTYIEQLGILPLYIEVLGIEGGI